MNITDNLFIQKVWQHIINMKLLTVEKPSKHSLYQKNCTEVLQKLN